MTSKLRNVKTTIDGVVFSSKKEGQRYLELRLMLRAGEITDLQVHPRFNLEVNDCKVCEFWPDFAYRKKNGALVVEDVKGRRAGVQYQLFRVKAKLFYALRGVEVIVK